MDTDKLEVSETEQNISKCAYFMRKTLHSNIYLYMLGCLNM